MTHPRHAHVRPKSVDGLPHNPFWKDERLRLTNMTTAQALRLLIIAVATFVVITAIVGIYVINLAQQQHSLAVQGRNDRLEFQKQIQDAVTQNEKGVQSLACYAANTRPRGTSAFLDGLASKYNCPPYVKPPASATSPAAAKPGSAPASVVPSPGASSVPQSPSSVTVQGGGAGQTHSSPPQSSGSGVNPTPTPSPSGPLSPITCHLLRLFC